MIDGVVDRQIPFLLFAERLLLELRDLRLMLERRLAPLHVGIVGDVRRDRARDLLAAHQFEVQHHLRRARKQHLVVRDEQHGLSHRLQKRFEPQKRIEIEVIARLVQKQHVAVVQKQRAQRKLHALAAGQRRHRLIGEREPVGEIHVLHRAGQRLRLDVLAAVRRKIRRNGQPPVLLGDLLRQIPDGAVDVGVAGHGGIALDERGIIQPLQKRRFAVALLADQRRLFAARDRKGEVFDDRFLITVDYNGTVSDLYRNNHLFLMFA